MIREIGSENLKKADQQNAEYRKKNGKLDICYLHDYCDANMVLFDTVKDTYGVEISIEKNDHVDFTNRAWKFGQEKGFALLAELDILCEELGEVMPSLMVEIMYCFENQERLYRSDCYQDIDRIDVDDLTREEADALKVSLFKLTDRILDITHPMS